MFLLVILTDEIELSPDKLKFEYVQAMKKSINKKYVGQVLHDNIGYCLGVYDILKFEEPMINEGVIFQTVKFRMVVFKPKENELLIGKIINHDKTKGVQISLNFFSNIFLPPNNLLPNSFFDETSSTWKWKEGEFLQFEYKKGDVIKFKVESVYFNNENQVDEKPKLLNKELVDLQLMTPEERKIHETTKKEERRLRVRREDESFRNKPPDMYIIGQLISYNNPKLNFVEKDDN